MALACRVEEPSTASDSDTIASVADQFETDITTPGNGSVKHKSFRASSLRGSRETEVLRRIGRAGPPPTRQDLIDVQRAEARRRPLHSSCVDLGDLDVERGDPMTDGRFVVKLLDRGEFCLHLAEQLKRWRQHGDLLALDELLHPPERVMFLTEVREWLAGPRQVGEGSRFRRNANLRVDPRLPARPRRLSLCHSAYVASY